MQDPATTLCRENLPPIGSAGHTVCIKAKLLLIGQGATMESELLPGEPTEVKQKKYVV